MCTKHSFLVLSVLLVMSVGLAQETTPILVLDEGTATSTKLELTKVDVDVRIHGPLAQTSMTMTFANPTQHVLSGDLIFPLPEGATVSGYALDVPDRMVPGGVVEKHKARRVFKAKVRKGVDPGLVEKFKGNNFRTRVFPIPAQGSRTIMVRYVAEIVDTDEGAAYHLPLNYQDPVKHFSLRVEVVKAATKPTVHQGGIDRFKFSPWRDGFVADTTLTDTSLIEDLIVLLPNKSQPKVLVEKALDGQYYFMINDWPTIPQAPDRTVPKRIAILWDASGSRAKVSHAQEFALLKHYWRAFPEARIEVDLVLFRHAAAAPVRYLVEHGKCPALIKALQEVQYNGDTQMGAMIPADLEQPNAYLLFSDGLSNFEKKDTENLARPVYGISVDSASHHSFLRYLALKSGGAYFNLKRVTPQVAAASIGGSPFMFQSVTGRGVRNADIYPSIRQTVHGRFCLTGRLNRERMALSVHYGHPGVSRLPVRFQVSRQEAVRGDLLRRYWAQKKKNELSIYATQ
jgi:Ca-activated chloride channel homolog